MVISKLSDAEISRWIAAKLEPQPPDFVFGDARLISTDQNLKVSPRGYWSMAFNRDRQPFPYYWQPRDMVNDPAMTVMLLEKMVQGRMVAISQHNGSYQFGLGDLHVDAKSLGRVVADMFCVINGITECAAHS